MFIFAKNILKNEILFQIVRSKIMYKKWITPIVLAILCYPRLIYGETAEECYEAEAEDGTKSEETGIKLLCFNIKQKIPSNYTLPNITTILIFKAEMTAITENFFNNFDKHQIRTLSMSRGNLSRLDNTSFNTLTELKHLNLSFNKISNISENAFQKNYKLKSLSLMSNEIKHLHPNTFSTLVDLESIDLTRNHLKKLEKHLFINNRNLVYLDVKFNELSEISGVIFHHLPMLKSVDLSFNRIEKVPPHIFKYNFKLKELNLQENRITTLDYALFHLALDALNLLGNPLDVHDEKTQEVLKHLRNSNMKLDVHTHNEHKHKKPNTEQVLKASPGLQFVLGGILFLLVIILILLSILLNHLRLQKRGVLI